MVLTIITLLITIVFFIWGRIRSDIVAMMALMVLTASGVLTIQEALSGFSSPIVLMMVGLFIVGGAILQTGLAQSVGNSIARLSGGNETRAFVLVMLATAVIGAFVSNTGTVAIMMPIIMSMAATSNIRASRLLMPVAFAGSLGGMLTLIGTPPNLVISETLQRAGFKPLGFFSFFPTGVIVIVIGVLVLLPLSLWLIKKADGKKRRKGQSLSALAKQYHLTEKIYKYHVGKEARGLNGMRVKELDLQRRYGLTLLEIRSERKRAFGKVIDQHMAWADSVISHGDILFFYGDQAGMQRLAADYRLQNLRSSHLDFYDIGISEIVILPTSRLIGTRIKDSRLREDYALNILGIRRDEERITEDLGAHRLHNGDILLVQGKWDAIIQMNQENENWVALGRPDMKAAKVIFDYKSPVAAIIMLLMVLTMVFDFIPIAPVTAVLMASLFVILTGCFRSVNAASQRADVLVAAVWKLSRTQAKEAFLMGKVFRNGAALSNPAEVLKAGDFVSLRGKGKFKLCHAEPRLTRSGRMYVDIAYYI